MPAALAATSSEFPARINSTTRWVVAASSFALGIANLHLEPLPSLPNDVAVARVLLDQHRLAAESRCRDQRAPRSAEDVEHRLAGDGAVAQRAGNQLNGLLGRVLV